MTRLGADDLNADTGFWRNRRVFVTGAGGFVGSWLAKTLVDAGASVTALVRDRPTPDSLDLLGLSGAVNRVLGTVTDQGLVERILNEYEIDTCFHLAAQAIVGAANRSPVSTFESNIQGTWCLLEAARRSGTVERIVVASSDKAYGDQAVLPYTEDMPLLGLSPYDASKACADILARSYYRAFDLPVVVGRLANVYGGGDLNLSRLVPGTIRSAYLAENPVIRSDGTPLRDYIHVDDAVAAYLCLGRNATADGVVGQAFNFGANQPINVLDMVEKVLVACGRSDLKPDVRGRGPIAGEITHQYLDSSAAAKMGWAARVQFDEGLSRTVAWYMPYFKAHATVSGADGASDDF